MLSFRTPPYSNLTHDVTRVSLVSLVSVLNIALPTLAFRIGSFITDILPHVRFWHRLANRTTPYGNTFGSVIVGIRALADRRFEMGPPVINEVNVKWGLARTRHRLVLGSDRGDLWA